jgi:hypothetical protein
MIMPSDNTEAHTRAVSTNVQLLWTYSVYGFLVLFGSGWVLVARFLPPPSPNDSAAEIARTFRADDLRIRVGMCMCVAAAAFVLLWGAAIGAQLRLLDNSAMLAYTWISANTILCILLIYPCLWWALAAFRPEAAPETIRSLNDMAWLGFFGIVSTALVQCLVLAVAAFSDTSPDPIYPRWFGYFQLWCLVSYTPDLFVFLFKSGPLAWNGILACWLVLAVTFAWIPVTAHMTAKAIKRAATGPPAVPKPTLEERLAALERISSP